MFVINHKTQLFERVVIENDAENGDNKKIEYDYIPVESPPLRPRLRADGRFFLTEDGQLYDSSTGKNIPYSTSSKNVGVTFADYAYNHEINYRFD
jgi:hypothetical protein